MNRDELIDLVVQIVEERQGCKNVELATEVLGTFIDRYRKDGWDHTLLTGEIVAAIAAAVEQRRLIEIEYVVPAMPTVVKSFFLPSGTRIVMDGLL